MRIDEMLCSSAGDIGLDVADILDAIAPVDARDPAALAALRPCPLTVAALSGRRPSGIAVARTFQVSAARRSTRIACPSDHFMVTVALVDAEIAIEQDFRPLVGEKVIAGTVCVNAPGRRLTIRSRSACDLIHLAIPASVMRRHGGGHRDFDHVALRDPLIGRIALLLGEAPARWLAVYAELLCELAVARLVQLIPSDTVRPLPLWRLKRVQAFVDANIDTPLRLADLAAAARLSRMYFASQFRVATGLTPHNYVLSRRIARAKMAMAAGDTALVEIALDSGFQSQAHFCNIFRRLTGLTPSAWRQQATVEQIHLPAEHNIPAPPDHLPAAAFLPPGAAGRAPARTDVA